MKLGVALRAFIPTVYFNFRYLPFKQALKLPIWIYKPHFVSLRGSVVIEASKISSGMIRLGFLTATAYPNNGISWNNEGMIIFKGKCVIGNNAFIVTGKRGVIEFGENFCSTTSLKIISCIGIKFGKSVTLGWEVIIMDTNFHPLYDIEKNKFKKAYGEIVIGEYNWFSSQCYIMHSVHTPERCVFGARSVLVNGGKYEPYCVYGGNPVRVLSRNIICDMDKKLDYSKAND
ncbi:acyltransferase [Bacteroides thetaiotaomicron]|jgi:acetyltransferase-like isoleucine patch superfamily enzyme|uniref:acyltransferase n=1 Tax=Bacteroides thetaiotaomicron TaxID=818 RepID=UPI001F23A20D|nr:hypothetical protein [Bacteroides thetaiotaomicron]MCE8949399.1 hypothetical protein [Bacteroides thetaiotaomicron]MCE8967467.1 hypothetical protein [Bacteroides thetaiotaomicron]MCS3198568.1 hypothetical protein [Bacteroides thetaiotaomicron]